MDKEIDSVELEGVKIPEDFDGAKFVEKFGLDDFDFRVVDGKLYLRTDRDITLEITEEDLEDCVLDAKISKN